MDAKIVINVKISSEDYLNNATKIEDSYQNFVAKIKEEITELKKVLKDYSTLDIDINDTVNIV